MKYQIHFFLGHISNNKLFSKNVDEAAFKTFKKTSFDAIKINGIIWKVIMKKETNDTPGYTNLIYIIDTMSIGNL